MLFVRSTFIVRTDHAALTYLHKFAGNNARLLRWSLRVAEYDFSVQYRPGAKIPHVDSLSRHICALASNPEVSKDKVGREQAHIQIQGIAPSSSYMGVIWSNHTLTI